MIFIAQYEYFNIPEVMSTGDLIKKKVGHNGLEFEKWCNFTIHFDWFEKGDKAI